MRHRYVVPIGVLLLLALSGRAALAAPPCGGDGPALQVLGSGDASLTARRAGSGVLVWVDGRARVLINAGSGVALRFQESGAQWNDLDVILFTRLDVVHTDDLAALLHAAQASGRTRALPVYGPAGNKFAPSTVTFVRDLFDPVRGVYRQLGNLLAPLDRSGYKLEPHDVREPPARLAAPRRSGSALLPVFSNERVQLRAVLHAAEPVPVLSWRIEAGTASMAVSGGTGPQDVLAALSEGASLLVWPASAVVNGGSTGPAAKPRQIILAGRGPGSATREDEIATMARKHGSVVWADDLACYRP